MGSEKPSWKTFLKHQILAILFFCLGLPVAYFGGFHDWDQELFLGHSFPYSREKVFLTTMAIYVIVTLIDAFIRFTDKKNLSLEMDRSQELSATNDEISQRLISYFDPIIRDLLQRVFDELKYDVDERITAYKVEDGYYWPIGRVSDNELYKLYHRRSYPKEEGCISAAWEKGYANYQNYPSDIDQWCSKQEKKWNIPYKTAYHMSMKSKSMFAMRINNSEGPLVVLVFESMRNKINKNERKNIRELLKQYKNELEKVFSDYHEFGPKFDMAPKDKGF